MSFPMEEWVVRHLVKLCGLAAANVDFVRRNIRKLAICRRLTQAGKGGGDGETGRRGGNSAGATGRSPGLSLPCPLAA
jgi:hypothetical protein